MIYKIKIRPKALKFIEKQDKYQRLRIYKAIYNLPKGDVKKMAGCKNEYRLRVGNYRIIYEHNQNEFIILITKAENRGQIYK
ncbi:MAG: type II toxin-antitoxin system RelE/ParE family toxin [Clostridia bacterium]|nr:type II toxin-antitoxin system RelE/ParE family toxin [Clostridia bacterium]